MSRRVQIEEMLKETPDDPFLRYGLAMEYVSAGDDRGAAERFRELVAVAPDYVPAYMQGGQVLVRLGQTGPAKEMWRRGVAVARRQGNSHAADEMEGFISEISD